MAVSELRVGDSTDALQTASFDTTKASRSLGLYKTELPILAYFGPLPSERHFLSVAYPTSR